MDLQQFLAFLPLMPQVQIGEDDPIPSWLRRILRELRAPVLGGTIGRPEVHQLPAVQARPRSSPPNPNRVMQQRGILPQMETGRPDRAERVYEAIYPVDYGNKQPGPTVLNEATRVWEKEQQSRTARMVRAILGVENSPRAQATPSREDAFRLYLGLPQRSGTFSVSRFRPTRSRNPSAVYMAVPAFLDYVREWGLGNDRGTVLTLAPGDVMTPAQAVELLVRRAEHQATTGERTYDAGGMIMGNFSLTKGEDQSGPYVSYYDSWDLSGSREGVRGRFGRPFEIYDRIYYDPKTFEPRRLQR